MGVNLSALTHTQKPTRTAAKRCDLQTSHISTNTSAIYFCLLTKLILMIWTFETFSPRLTHKNADKRIKIQKKLPSPTFSSILMVLPAEETRRCLLSTVKHGGGSVTVSAAISRDSLGPAIIPHSCVKTKEYEAIFTGRLQLYCCSSFMI